MHFLLSNSSSLGVRIYPKGETPFHHVTNSSLPLFLNVTIDYIDDVTPPTTTTRSVAELLSIATLLATIVVITIAGNLLVIATVWTNRSMHNVTNYFLVSLATTDLLLGCVVLPLSAVNTLSPTWPFGAVFCNLYVSCDVMLCTVSILTLFAISLDRYFAITSPFRYRNWMKSGIVWRISAGIWTFSGAMAFAPIHLGWNSPDGRVQNADRPTVCSLELNGPYALLVSLGTYFGPLVVMSGVYVRVLQVTRRQVKEINKLGRLARTPSKMNSDHQISQQRKSINKHSLTLSRRGSTDTIPPSAARAGAVASDRKAIVSLASIVLAFGVCWIPYFVLFTLKPFLGLRLATGFGYHFELFALWLGYTNSSINPFIYAFCNSSFRHGFRKLLLCGGGGGGGCNAARDGHHAGGGGLRSCDWASTANGREWDLPSSAAGTRVEPGKTGGHGQKTSPTKPQSNVALSHARGLDKTHGGSSGILGGKWGLVRDHRSPPDNAPIGGSSGILGGKWGLVRDHRSPPDNAPVGGSSGILGGTWGLVRDHRSPPDKAPIGGSPGTRPDPPSAPPVVARRTADPAGLWASLVSRGRRRLRCEKAKTSTNVNHASTNNDHAVPGVRLLSRYRRRNFISMSLKGTTWTKSSSSVSSADVTVV